MLITYNFKVFNKLEEGIYLKKKLNKKLTDKNNFFFYQNGTAANIFSTLDTDPDNWAFL